MDLTLHHSFMKPPNRPKPLIFTPPKCSLQHHPPPIPSLSSPPISHTRSKLGRLISEFQSLSQPIDRVKRLLHYAAMLPPLADSNRVEVNRVPGCAVQVWVWGEMGWDGGMRFCADSDSEMAKGLCSCLAWVLEGASPEEVLELKAEELGDLNVGLPGRAQSRVNTWHGVLASMQRRTREVVAERRETETEKP